MKSVLQAGHWKSLKTSMMMGADLEPAATCGSISGTGAEDCRAFAPSPEANSNAAKPARVKASELAPRERFTQSSSVLRYNPTTSRNITCDSGRNEESLQSMCATAASSLLHKMRLAGGALAGERTPGGFPRVRRDPQRPTCGRQAKALLIWP